MRAFKHIFIVAILLAVILGCVVARAAPDFQTVHAGCVLVIQGSHSTYVPEYGVILVGEGDCHE